MRFNWTQECAQNFAKIKSDLLLAEPLILPAFDKTFYLSCDASDKALGYVLQQLDDSGKMRTVSSNGRSLNPIETRYSTVERECLGIVEGIKFFRPYLAARKFVVLTDHKGLSVLTNDKSKLKNARLMRWSVYLSQYQFSIQHVSGTNNVLADAISRLYH